MEGPSSLFGFAGRISLCRVACFSVTCACAHWRFSLEVCSVVVSVFQKTRWSPRMVSSLLVVRGFTRGNLASALH